MMKKITKLMMASVIVFFGFNQVNAQNDLDQLLEAGIEDATILIEGYVDPFMVGFGTGLSNGWYNTAKAHKSLGFDLTVTANVAYVPDEDMFFNVNGLNLQTVELDDPVYSDGNIPTMFGPDSDTPTFREINTGETFEGPAGLGIKDEIGFNAVPVPMAQLGIGIVKNTDLKIRWTPEVDIGDDGKFKLFGFGVMHDVKQHIPGLKNFPFDLSAFIGYTKMKTTIDFTNGDPTLDQTGDFEIRTLTVQGLISKKFSVLTFYGGLGFNRVRSDLGLRGEYDINNDGDFNDANEVNPISLEFKSGGPRMTLGMRLKLAILTLHADYTLQKYKTLSLGVGFSVR
ncbi:hypothetical protein JMN32_13005 [Fulvivirga sp. 29W222]|uniref:Outer membrane protein beta-barrel domain-containing protein n=1 Tax=Fulvivirga marina TaxID=2494733 RepID=A0A937FWD5_9BACT|nr:DUF6588 family protein [Fulvivirga marina]MBL6447234.1 hypothetical protein [Fulvivirga marina]